MAVRTYARINLQATSQLTPAEYNSDPHRPAPLNTHTPSASPRVPRFICVRTPARATCDDTHDPSRKKKRSGGMVRPDVDAGGR